MRFEARSLSTFWKLEALPAADGPRHDGDLRRLDRARAMQRVKDLSWGLRFEALEEEAPTRIELVCEALQASA